MKERKKSRLRIFQTGVFVSAICYVYRTVCCHQVQEKDYICNSLLDKNKGDKNYCMYTVQRARYMSTALDTHYSVRASLGPV